MDPGPRDVYQTRIKRSSLDSVRDVNQGCAVPDCRPLLPFKHLLAHPKFGATHGIRIQLTEQGFHDATVAAAPVDGPPVGVWQRYTELSDPRKRRGRTR
jgi:hypothetical protein